MHMYICEIVIVYGLMQNFRIERNSCLNLRFCYTNLLNEVKYLEHVIFAARYTICMVLLDLLYGHSYKL